MKEAAVADNEKVVIGGTRFFLGGDKEREDAEEESDEDEAVDMGKLKHSMGVSKFSKKKSKALERAASTVKKKAKKKNQPHPLNFSALHLLHDPQGFAETLFSKHLQNGKSRLNLEQKLQVLQLVSRLVGLHKLTIMSLYSYFLKYLAPRQPSVTSFLASLAQATHSLVPPDVLEPLVLKIANEFVSEAAASEVASAGLNAIREICMRQPLAMNDTLLQDLVMYRKSKDKGVMMAAKGLLSLYREVGAEMLKRRDRGKEATIGIIAGEKKERRFGEEAVGEIEGLELLERWKEEEKKRKRIEKGLDPDDSDVDGENEEEDEEDWKAWDVEDDDSDDSDGWIDVSSEGEIDISDDEDDKPKPPPTKKVKFDIPTNTVDDEKENPPTSPSTATAEANRKPKPSIATTRILTPADLAKLHELRTTSSITSLLPSVSSQSQPTHQKHHSRPPSNPTSTRHPDDPLTAAEISGLSALSAPKLSREAKIRHAREGRDEREYKGKEARRKERKEEQGKSTTNREKARRKNFLMTVGKRRKDGRSNLVGVGKRLKAGEGKGKGKQQRGKGGGRK
jgi:protein SDA1